MLRVRALAGMVFVNCIFKEVYDVEFALEVGEIARVHSD